MFSTGFGMSFNLARMLEGCQVILLTSWLGLSVCSDRSCLLGFGSRTRLLAWAMMDGSVEEVSSAILLAKDALAGFAEKVSAAFSPHMPPRAKRTWAKFCT